MATTRLTAPTPFPCGLPADYAQCCGRWHGGPMHLLAPDAELLMRSRYSAFVLDLHDYLLDTWDPQHRPAALAPNPKSLRWLGLEVLRHERLDEHHALVEFIARSAQGSRQHRLHEVSRFQRQGGRWRYVDALSVTFE